MTGPSDVGVRPDPGHPDLETLAEWQEGVLPGDGAAAVGAHVAGCPVCAGALDDLDATRATLAAVPAEPLPDDIAGRLDAVLAGLRPPADPAGAVDSAPGGTGPGPATVVPLEGRPRQRWWRSGAVAGGAAAAAVALLVAGIVFGAVSGDRREQRERDTVAGGATTGGAGPLTTMASGRDYQRATLEAAAPALATAARKETRANAGTSGAGEQTATAPTSLSAPLSDAGAAKVPAPLERLRADRSALEACLSAVTGETGVAPLAVDLARYAGKPAAVIVLPAAAGRLDVFVVGPGCGQQKDAKLILFLRVPA